MKIEPDVEDPLRRTLAAVVDENPDGMVPPLEPLTEEQGRLAGTYAMFVINFVMHDVYEDPDADASDTMAEAVVKDASEWIEIGSTEEVSAFLLACAKWDASFPGVDQQRVGVYVFIIAGYLLSRFRPEDMRWFEYLDQIWNFAEQQSS